MGDISIKGKNLHYNIKGEGNTTVLFLHGFGEDSHMWNYVNDDINYRCICIDFPGFGLSDFQDDIRIPTLARYVRRVVEELEIKNPIPIGHSMGGYVALAYANAFPDETAAIGLINSHPFADNSDKVQQRNKSIQFVRTHGAAKYLPNFYNDLFHKKLGYLKNTLQHLLKKNIHIHDKIWISYLESMRDREDLQEFVKTWNKPILFLLGKHDRLISWEKNISQAALAPISDLVIMENSGHMSHLEERLKTRKAIIEFVEFVEKMRV